MSLYEDLGSDIKIAVLKGGVSAEREVSLRSGAAVVRGLQEAGFRNVKEIDITTDDEAVLTSLLKQMEVDLVFPVLHGRFGEDGRMQRLLERLGLVYVGSGPETHEKAINKARAQQWFKANGLLVPKHWVVCGDDAAVENNLASLPSEGLFIIKPASEGSSLGVQLAASKDELRKAVHEALHYDSVVLIEEFVRGREITCSVLTHQDLPVVEIKTKRPFFDYVAKYTPGETTYVCPAPLQDHQTRQAQSLARQIFNLLGARDFLRVDMILAESGELVVLEANTIPGMTATSLLPLAAAKAGLSFPELMHLLVESTLLRKPEGRTTSLKKEQRILTSPDQTANVIHDEP